MTALTAFLPDNRAMPELDWPEWDPARHALILIDQTPGGTCILRGGQEVCKDLLALTIANRYRQWLLNGQNVIDQRN